MAAASGAEPDWEHVAAEIERGRAARLPLTARDLQAEGLPPGPGIGRALSEAEQVWLDAGLALDKSALLTHLREQGQLP
jgi:poly(A) polymerase